MFQLRPRRACVGARTLTRLPRFFSWNIHQLPRSFGCSITEKTAMPTLEDFADEIFLAIFSHLLCLDLANACRINRRLGAIGQISLYRTPVLSSCRQEPNTLQVFLHTVIQNPQLAGYVRHLTLETRDSPDVDEIHDLSITTALSLPTIGSLGKQFRQSRLLLLLHLLPNLQTLTVLRDCVPDLLDTFIAHHVSPRETRTLPVGFRSLRHIHLEFNWSRPFGYTASTVMVLLSLPSIRTINVEIQDDFTPTEYAGISSSVVGLALRSGSITHESLGHVLQVPRALTRFTLEYCTLTQLVFHGPDFGRALRVVRATLQHLQLSLCDYTEIGPRFTDLCEPNTIGSLRDWPVLKSVRCPLTPLLGLGPEIAASRLVDVLPVGIVQFAIEGDHYWTGEEAADQIAAMLAPEDMGGLQSLEEIIIGRKISVEADMLAHACTAVGVVLCLNSSWC